MVITYDICECQKQLRHDNVNYLEYFHLLINILASHSFPYVTKRIQVLYHSEEELTPIEVAIDEMKNKTFELNDVVYQQPTDLKKLQLKLQGCVSAQVNAGPLAYAEAFLAGNKILNYKKDKVGALKEHFW